MLETIAQWLKNHGCIQSDLYISLSASRWHNIDLGFVINSDGIVSRGVVTLKRIHNNMGNNARLSPTPLSECRG